MAKKPTMALLVQPTYLFALGFGAGLMPFAPGTFGSLMAIPFLAMLMLAPPFYLYIIAGLSFLLGIIVCGACAQELGDHDHPSIVWDEIVGMFFTMLFVPINFNTIAIGFLCFRFFDIVKPWPIRYVDRNVHGGLGIMLDDVLAGLFAALLLYGIHSMLVSS